MTFDAIRLFILCAKYLSITKAARDVGIDRSAASRQLQQLQHELRTKLFHSRSGCGIELTKAGWTFLNDVSPIMSQLYALEKRYKHGEGVGILFDYTVRPEIEAFLALLRASATKTQSIETASRPISKKRHNGRMRDRTVRSKLF